MRVDEHRQQSCRVTGRLSDSQRARRPPSHMIPVSRQVLMGGNNATVIDSDPCKPATQNSYDIRIAAL